MEYAVDVMEGRIIACNYVQLCIERHFKDLDFGQSRGIWFNRKVGSVAVNFFKLLRHHKGEKAREEFVLEGWQQFYIYVLFGWMRIDGSRRFRRSYLSVARKNGKTTINAGKTLFHVLLDNESGAQVYFVATKEDQARIAFNDVCEIIRNSPAINNKFQVFKKSVVKGGSFMKPLGSDSKTQDGYDPSYGNVDEFAFHPDDSMLNVIESGMGARKQPLLDIITTRGFNTQSPCFKLEKVLIDILEGRKEDDAFFGMIFCLDPDDDYEDPENWIKANPNLGVSVKKEFLVDRLRQAKNEGSSKMVDFLTKNMNMWVDAPEVWIDQKVYDSNAKNTHESVLLSKKCYGGLDLGPSNDLTAFDLLFLDDHKQPFAVKSFFWMPKDKLKTSQDGVDYYQWVQDGYIKVMPGATINHADLAQDIMGLIAQYQMHSLAYDPYKADHGVIKALEDAEIQCHSLTQTTRVLGIPVDELEKLIYEQRLEHFGNPVLKWMFGNVVIVTDTSGNRKPDKKKSQNKIDGVSALVNAVGEWITFRSESESHYEENGLMWL